MTSRAPTLTLLLVLLAACGRTVPSGESVEGLRLSVRPDRVLAGDSVVLTLSNRSGETIGYNLCTSALERSTEGGWRDVPSERVCTMELRTLPPGDDARYTIGIEPDRTAGAYRFRADVEAGEADEVGVRRAVHSEPFRIER